MSEFATAWGILIQKSNMITAPMEKLARYETIALEKFIDGHDIVIAPEEMSQSSRMSSSAETEETNTEERYSPPKPKKNKEEEESKESNILRNKISLVKPFS